MEQKGKHMNPQLDGQFIFDKGGKTIQWEKVSSINSVGDTGQQHAKE